LYNLFVGKWLHILKQKDTQNKIGLCAYCGPIQIIWKKDRWICYTVYRRWKKEHVYTKYKKEFCEKCPFIPAHPSQLDVDHIDGNHSNHNPENLQTLCANCHRLKTINNQDYKKSPQLIVEDFSLPN